MSVDGGVCLLFPELDLKADWPMGRSDPCRVNAARGVSRLWAEQRGEYGSKQVWGGIWFHRVTQSA